MKYIDDIIRKEKRKWAEQNKIPVLTFYWGRQGYEQLRNYISNVIICPHGLECITCDVGEKNIDIIMGASRWRFMGANHEWDKRRNGFLIKIKRIFPRKVKKINLFYGK